ncbi:conserved hypothetical protein [Burkholderia diffusa]|uniref:DUF4123 domain-containing protein n=1 Tax=Burkholderia diffusa TaxID=488732 RepID=UPI001CAE3E66|nr:DUF4123 domain-containing protein [Burkholderia diffusa]CAG9258338.1 conserved hypothetical protein [Burkholderia diffusa]
MNAVPFQVERFAELTQWLESVDTGHDMPLHLYAFVDGALNEDMLRLVSERAAAWQCLYPETMLEAASPAIGPYLVEIQLDDQAQAALARALLRQSEHADLVLWVASRMSLSALSGHFYAFAEVGLPDGRQALLRYYDPLIFEALLDAFTPEQRDLFTAPYRALRYWRGGWKEVEGLNQGDGDLEAASELKLTAEQQQRLARATLAETVYHEIKGELLPPMSEVDDRTAISYTRELIERAADRYQIGNRDELILFALTALNVNRTFDWHPEIGMKLDPHARDGKSLREVLAEISPRVWEDAGAGSHVSMTVM